MNFKDSIRFGFKNSFDFKGVSRRSEYWYLLLVAVFVWVVASALDSVLAPFFGAVKDPFFSPIELVSALVLVLPVISVSARRLHDSGKTAHLLWLALIPVGSIAFSVVRFAEFAQSLKSLNVTSLPNDLLGAMLVAMLSTVLVGLLMLILMLLLTKSAAKGNRFAPEDLPMPVIPDEPVTPTSGVINIGL